MAFQENPFVFGEIIDDANFVNRTDELSNLVRDLADGQKVFLLSPRRFGKSSLVALALLKLQKKHIHTVNLTVSSYSSYAQFLEKFAEKVLRAGGSWERVEDLVRRFVQRINPGAKIALPTGQTSLSFKVAEANPSLFAPPGF